ncbi:hypothetical protein SAMN06265379_10252 [Saccharicrinis carchari]|uniref:dTDP-4-amino-4,6-dideoxygalactose transaminase n=1 Tax=Saccharicrinis carchari TaxID=1168039 RepID=A0A521BTG5_SACCC|nr:hypothetical protein [Saccharicrinis carchari]SMO50464.1 hypothetical protein SAMN06265379_10252 [Saccharicrinis carchari]
MKEIGSFIGLDLEGTHEYYNNELDMARLNSARSGIYHACGLYGYHTVYLPYYLCPSVNKYLTDHGIKTIKYHINAHFEPIDVKQEDNSAFVIVNYFGILSHSKMKAIAGKFRNVIVDNSAAFYAQPVEDCYSVYSPRKFFGVPDGCYVIGQYASKGMDAYAQDRSAGTSSFLFATIEQGTNLTYSERMKNEERIDKSGPLRMSALTQCLLKNVNYPRIAAKRKENFKYAHFHFSKINQLDPLQSFDDTCVPMVYPLLIEKEDLDKKLREKKVYVGRLWTSVLQQVDPDTFEARMSKYMVPLPIDQRYGRSEINCMHQYVMDVLT